MIRLLWLFLLWPMLALAQMPPVQPHNQRDWFSSKVEVELRLKSVPDAKGETQTVRLRTLKFSSIGARYYRHKELCWNKASNCPLVGSATIRVYVKLPWTTRMNVTKYTMCNASECLLPAFSPIAAKPGESYSFGYDRVKAIWFSHPSIEGVQ